MRSEGITYKDGILTIYNIRDKMYFKCDEEFAARILSSIQQAIANPVNLNGPRFNVRNKREDIIDMRCNCDYVEVGDTDGIKLFVGYTGMSLTDGYLIIFTYVSDTLPNRNGSTQVNICMDIK